MIRCINCTRCCRPTPIASRWLPSIVAAASATGEVKKALADLAENYFAAARERRKELEGNPKQIQEILGDGAARARKKAAQVLARAREACGAGLSR